MCITRSGYGMIYTDNVACENREWLGNGIY